MIISINFLQKYIVVLALSTANRVSSANTNKLKVKFEEIQVSFTEIQSLEPLGDQHEEVLRVLSMHGICGECRRIFRIMQGDISKKSESTLALQQVQAELLQCQNLKREYVASKKCAKVLECTATTKKLQDQIDKLKRNLEYFTHISCPFCGWVEKRQTLHKPTTAA